MSVLSGCIIAAYVPLRDDYERERPEKVIVKRAA